MIPAYMRDARRWLVWLEVPQPGKKARKVPFCVDGAQRQGVLDSPEDMARLGTYEQAAALLARGGYAGLGFALGPDGTGNCWQGVDFDHLDQHPELADPVAAAIASGFYVERSPSGTGVHVLGYGAPFDALGSNASGIEAYSAGRFFTVTGIAP